MPTIFSNADDVSEVIDLIHQAVRLRPYRPEQADPIITQIVAKLYKALALPPHRSVDLLRESMIAWHQPLHDAEVRVLVLLCANKDGAAIKVGGYPAAACIQPLSLEWRVATGFDAKLKIDEAVWESLDENERSALIDHELSHLDLCDVGEAIDGSIRFKRDDIGRPKLQSLDGDWNGGDGFIEVVKRHGSSAVEYTNSKRVHAKAVAALREGIDEETQRSIP